MTLKALVVAAMLTAVSTPSASAPIQQTGTAVSPRLERLERWLEAVLQHNPGSSDARIIDLGKWSNGDLDTVFFDAVTVVRIIRTPGLASINAGLLLMVPTDRNGQQAPRPPRYTPREDSRIKSIACAVGGLADASPCEWTSRAIVDDPALRALSTAAAAVRRDLNGNFIVRRGALMHSDIAMLGLAAPVAVDTTPGRQNVRMSFSDGRQTSVTQADLHWEFGRKLQDLVAAPNTMKPAPGGDQLVRRWYVATAAWMQQGGHHDNTHLDRGRELFPDDPDLALLSGAQHEAYAAAAVQTAVRSAFLPTGVRLAVQSERAELREAERGLRRAVELKADLAEAQIRYGRVLSLLGRDAEAVDHLNRGLAATDEPLLRYYGSLFLGAAEEKLGHADSASAAYEGAASLYPRAQSPRLALSELARRSGQRDRALREIERVYTIAPHGSLDDPWWTYSYAQGRHADELLDAIQKPFRLPVAQAP